jgi:hypothetical protein
MFPADGRKVMIAWENIGDWSEGNSSLTWSNESTCYGSPNYHLLLMTENFMKVQIEYGGFGTVFKGQSGIVSVTLTVAVIRLNNKLTSQVET